MLSEIMIYSISKGSRILFFWFIKLQLWRINREIHWVLCLFASFLEAYSTFLKTQKLDLHFLDVFFGFTESFSLKMNWEIFEFQNHTLILFSLEAPNLWDSSQLACLQGSFFFRFYLVRLAKSPESPNDKNPILNINLLILFKLTYSL